MEGLLLCHADARADDDEGGAPLVTLTPLAEEIAAGKDGQSFPDASSRHGN